MNPSKLAAAWTHVGTGVGVGVGLFFFKVSFTRYGAKVRPLLGYRAGQHIPNRDGKLTLRPQYSGGRRKIRYSTLKGLLIWEKGVRK